MIRRLPAALLGRIDAAPAPPWWLLPTVSLALGLFLGMRIGDYHGPAVWSVVAIDVAAVIGMEVWRRQRRQERIDADDVVFPAVGEDTVWTYAVVAGRVYGLADGELYPLTDMSGNPLQEGGPVVRIDPVNDSITVEWLEKE